MWFDQCQEFIQLLLGIHDLDNDRQIFGECIKPEGVDLPRVRAKPHHAAQYGCTRQTLLTRLQHDPFIERLVLKFIRLAKENAEPDPLLWKIHSNLTGSAVAEHRATTIHAS